MPDGLKSKTLHALFWSFFERIGQQGIQFIISIILARLLLPKQFGLIAMLTIFMGVAQSFINSGFGQALIQKQDATYIDEMLDILFQYPCGLSCGWFAVRPLENAQFRLSSRKAKILTAGIH